MEDLKILATPRDLAKPMPRVQLIPIITIIQAVSDLSDGEASIPELLDALHGCYDCDTMMMYRGMGYGLADALDGLAYEEHSGFNERRDITADLFNSCYWRESGVTILHFGENYDPEEFLMTKADGLKLAMRLWEFFAPDRTFDYDHFKTLTRKASKPSPIKDGQTLKIDQGQGIDIDPLDLPEELDAANMAFRAVLKGHGDKSATFKNRLIDYLEKNFTGLNNESVQRIATVANPDKGRGRKKINAE